MPLAKRAPFIENASNDTVNHLSDRPNKFAQYFCDNPYDDIASAIFYLKIFPSEKYGYVVFIHMMKEPPQASNTFVLAPSNSRWIDVTSEVLPEVVSRDWYFQPSWRNNVVETGPYVRQKPGKGWSWGEKCYDLIWHGNCFAARPAKTSQFSFPP